MSKAFFQLSIAIAAAVLLSLPCQGDLIYNVTFEDPPHTNGLVPTYGGGIDRPSDGSWFTVSNGLSGFSSQAAVVDDQAGYYASMNFGSLTGVAWSTGVHIIEWDFMMLQTDTNIEPQSWMSLERSFGPSYEIAMRHFAGGNMTVEDVDTGSGTNAPYSVGQVYRYTLTVDLDANLYDFSIDGLEILSDAALSSDMDIVRVGFERPFGSSRYAIDDFRWEVIPEPGTIGLLGLGGLALWFSKPWKKRRKFFQGLEK